MAKKTKPADAAFDWSGLADEVRAALAEALAGLLDGAAEDVRRYVAAIAGDLVRAAATDRPDLVDELRAQLRLIGEINRVRAANAGWEAVEAVVAAVFRVLIAGLARSVTPA